MDDAATLFDLGGPDINGPWELREVTHETANRWVDRFHYLGGMPAGAMYRVAAFAPDCLGIVVYATPSNAHGLAKKFGLEPWPGNLEIARVAVHPDAPTNTTSRLVAACNRFVARASGLAWLFSYADTGQGHHGGIYQALNAVYVGVSATRPGYLLDGEPIHPRSVVSWLGTQAREEAPRLAAERGHDLVWVEDLNTAKHTYIIPVGSARDRHAIRSHLAQFVHPYPTRDTPITPDLIYTENDDGQLLLFVEGM